MKDTIDMLREASRYIQASVKTTADDEPATESDHEAHDLACKLACEADRLERTSVVPAADVQPEAERRAA